MRSAPPQGVDVLSLSLLQSDVYTFSANGQVKVRGARASLRAPSSRD